jgi:predicted nucleotide-binding protein
MLQRFTDGDDGRRRLEEALRDQWLVANNIELAKELADCVDLKQYSRGDVIVERGGTDTEFYMILIGSVVVDTGRGEVLCRTAKQHFRAMGIIDTAATRTSTILAKDDTLIACLKEPSFARIAERHPYIWRRLAMEMGRRLREQPTVVLSPNKVFVVHGHDDEAKESVARFLERLGLETVVLNEQSNRGRTIIEKLEGHADVAFAVVLLTPDDRGESKDKPYDNQELRARQNVIFELGNFLAKLGRRNVCALQTWHFDPKRL